MTDEQKARVRASVKKYRATPKGKANRKAYRASGRYIDPMKGKRDSDRRHCWKRHGVDLSTVPTWIATCCAICQDADTICLDHDHATGKFRGWICRRCNTILGLAEDNPALLKLLALYVEAE